MTDAEYFAKICERYGKADEDAPVWYDIYMEDQK